MKLKNELAAKWVQDNTSLKDVKVGDWIPGSDAYLAYIAGWEALAKILREKTITFSIEDQTYITLHSSAINQFIDKVDNEEAQ